jgi:homoserine O-acetyltransferase
VCRRNTPPPHDKANFPKVTFYDQVEAQHKLVAEHFGGDCKTIGVTPIKECGPDD